MARLGTSEAAAGLMIETVGGRQTPRITVESTRFAENLRIPDANSDYGDGLSPQLQLSAAPAVTRAIALVAEDPAAPLDTPFTHWLLYTLPADVNQLPPAIPPD